MNLTTIAVLVQIVLTLVFSIAGFANYFMLQSIDAKISRLDSAIREWSRGMFAEKKAVETLEERVHNLELRRHGN